ncbi:hypothetical protein C8J31_12423 [Rhizobium sp. PP-CC-2G-626]|nr:hypothetical protein C8J31_12423 [Rhizobium sp. PP-CC-2G-626]
MTRLLILTAVSLFAIAIICFLYRTDRLPPSLVRNIDMLAILFGIFVTTPITIAIWQGFVPIPQDLSWETAAGIVFTTIMQFLGIQLTRTALGLSARNRS